MNNRNIAIALAIIIIAAGGFMAYKAYQSSPSPDGSDTLSAYPTTAIALQSPMASLAVIGKTISLDEQNDTGESGKATLTEENGKVKVVLKMDGEPDKAIQPTHIHVGMCPNPGAVKYPLTNVVDGTSETILNVTMDELKSQLPLAINVHESAAKINNYVACGNLDL